MAERDQLKWNRKYTETPALLQPRPPSGMVAKRFSLAGGREAVDLACGSGKNAIFLAKQGFHVDAFDISEVALAHLRKQAASLAVTASQTDLDTFTPAPGRYDLAVMANYLDRALICRTAEALRIGGLFIVETYMEDPANEKEGSNPAFLLKKGELLKLFDAAFTVVEYREFWNESYERYRMKKASIVVKKRGS